MDFKLFLLLSLPKFIASFLNIFINKLKTQGNPCMHNNIERILHLPVRSAVFPYFYNYK